MNSGLITVATGSPTVPALVFDSSAVGQTYSGRPVSIVHIYNLESAAYISIWINEINTAAQYTTATLISPTFGNWAVIPPGGSELFRIGDNQLAKIYIGYDASINGQPGVRPETVQVIMNFVGKTTPLEM